MVIGLKRVRSFSFVVTGTGRVEQHQNLPIVRMSFFGSQHKANNQSIVIRSDKVRTRLRKGMNVGANESVLHLSRVLIVSFVMNCHCNPFTDSVSSDSKMKHHAERLTLPID